MRRPPGRGAGGGCSFVIAHASDAILAPGSVLITVWFAMLARVYRPTGHGEEAQFVQAVPR